MPVVEQSTRAPEQFVRCASGDSDQWRRPLSTPGNHCLITVTGISDFSLRWNETP
jgi:hypothetical protein